MMMHRKLQHLSYLRIGRKQVTSDGKTPFSRWFIQVKSAAKLPGPGQSEFRNIKLKTLQSFPVADAAAFALASTGAHS